MPCSYEEDRIAGHSVLRPRDWNCERRVRACMELGDACMEHSACEGNEPARGRRYEDVRIMAVPETWSIGGGGLRGGELDAEEFGGVEQEDFGADGIF
jgi:hypothetical protein